jgi:hypothetical protein
VDDASVSQQKIGKKREKTFIQSQQVMYVRFCALKEDQRN